MTDESDKILASAMEMLANMLEQVQESAAGSEELHAERDYLLMEVLRLREENAALKDKLEWLTSTKH